MLLKIANLHVTYRHQTRPVNAVTDVSLDLKPGEAIGLIGESGCGKTSLALSILRLLKNADIQGEIRYNDSNLLALDHALLTRFRWRHIAIAFQNAVEVLNPVMTIEDQISEPIRQHFSLSKAAIRERVAELLDTVELDPRWQNSYPHQLSGGMRQRVLLAMALSCHPNVLILDEPTTSLDAAGKRTLIAMLQKLKENNGFSMLVISHDVEVITALTSKIFVLYNGRIVETGGTKDIIESPLHTYTRGFLNSSPALFKYKDLWGIRGEPEQGKSVQGCVFYARCPQRTETCRRVVPELHQVADGRAVACHKGGIEVLLHAHGIRKKYVWNRHEIPALHGVDLMLKSGEVVALIGESGSGKSTLAHILSGVLQADSGQAFFLEKKITGHWATQMIGGMQIVFQDPLASTNHRMTVLDVVKEPLNILRVASHPEKNEKALAALKLVQLPTSAGFLTRYCYTLSGGQRQRLAIARAMMTDPRVLIADEITSMLDPSTQANFLRELKHIQNTCGFTMLYITHDLHLARKIADRIYVLHKGQIVESGPSFKIFDNPKYPYTQHLLGSLMGGITQ